MLENTLIIILGSLIICVLFAFVYSNAYKKSKKMTIDNFSVYYSKVYIGFMFFLSFFVIALAIFLRPYIANDGVSNPYVVYPIFIGLAIFFAIAGVVFSYNKIIVNKDTIIIIKALQRKKTYKVSDITKVKNTLDRRNNEYKAYVGKKKIFVFSKLMVGYELMCQKLNILDI